MPLALCLLAAALLAACGVPLDDAPRAIDQSTTSTSSPVTVASEPGGQDLSVFYLDGEQLVDVQVPAGDTPTVRDALTTVLGPPPEQPLVTRIPEGTQLLGVELDDRTAVINLSEEINNIEAARQTQAYAQLVFTALASDEADRVMFLVEGKAVQAPTDNGGLEVVGEDDYDPPLSPR